MRCVGPLTLQTLFGFREAMVEEAGRSLIVDFTEVPFVDSAGLGSLVQSYVTCLKAGKRLALVGVNHRVSALLLMSNLTKCFSVFPSRAEAEADFSGRGNG
ncbi:MAG TPA: STAS domain-containing protein [Candidatus Acidoferrales bacterium]|nr:STAS domain-containing protein [Candidatus Acidoferrales bacterium]